eukprot:TRINITY_DN3323_c0_g1_i3.p1 TRINITY_DN3323_c0_g1~~TRINITY_DN3323_c0_g1_i3.p1  ORF type:complete len:259 (+),score=42.37 TRINITY_DN3323_c0_g1_i3:194-970(+)
MIYKIKPADIEDSHYEQFDLSGQTRVLQAVQAILERPSTPTPSTSAPPPTMPPAPALIQSELGFTDKMWKRFESDITALLQDRPNPYVPATAQLEQQPHTQRMVLLIGLPGSGKSTLSERLLAAAPDTIFRVNQDEMGNRKACETAAKAALRRGQSVLVDRCNFDYDQRHVWIKLALAHGVNRIDAVHLLVAPDTCKARVAVRVDHPTIQDAELGAEVIDKFSSTFTVPIKAEGFYKVISHVHNTAEDTDRLVQLILE